MRHAGPTDAERATVLQMLRLAADWGDGPATKDRLAALCNMSTRLFEKCVQMLRRAGEPIASNGEGYWLARTPQELDATMRSLTHRLREQGRTIRGLRDARSGLVRGAARARQLEFVRA